MPVGIYEQAAVDGGAINTEMLARTPDLAQALITHRSPIQDAPEAFRVAADKSTGALRVVLEP